MHSKDKRQIKSHYRMRGMGDLITMYGGAAEDIENDYQSKKADFIKAKTEYDLSKDSKSRGVQLERMESLRKSMDSAKGKAKTIYRGLSDATSKAASSLSSGVKSLSKKMSSGIKTAGNKFRYGEKYNDECKICSNEFIENDVLLLLKCKHDFHDNCIKEWSMKNTIKCPRCME